MSRAPKETIPAKKPPPDAPEHIKAHWWRVHVVKLARPALAELIGYTERQIARMEDGTANGKPIPAESYVAYCMACAAVSAGVNFDWLNTLVMGERVEPAIYVVPNASAVLSHGAHEENFFTLQEAKLAYDALSAERKEIATITTRGRTYRHAEIERFFAAPPD